MSSSDNPVQITGIDHVVFRVKDPVASVNWYSSKLGLAPCRLEEFKQGKAPFPSVRVTSSFIIDFMPLNFGMKTEDGDLADPAVEQSSLRHPNNVDHFCLTVAGDNIEAVRKQLSAVGGFIASSGGSRPHRSCQILRHGPVVLTEARKACFFLDCAGTCCQHTQLHRQEPRLSLYACTL